jgi:hypothetical protein
MRAIAAADPSAFCEWLEVEVDGDRPELLSADFPAETLHADLVARVGQDRLLHVEFIRKPERDMAIRMVGYRAHLMKRHPGASIGQVAIILGEGWLQSCDDPANGFALGLRNVYLRERDADPLLARPVLAPVAVLAKGDVDARGAYLATAYKLAEPMPEGLRSMLRQAALDLATITLDRSTIDRIRKESGMTVESIADFYSETEVGQELGRRGIEQGIEQGIERTLAALLRSRFGNHGQVRAIAGQLARLPDQALAIDMIVRAQSLEDLLKELSH